MLDFQCVIYRVRGLKVKWTTCIVCCLVQKVLCTGTNRNVASSQIFKVVSKILSFLTPPVLCLEPVFLSFLSILPEHGNHPSEFSFIPQNINKLSLIWIFRFTTFNKQTMLPCMIYSFELIGICYIIAEKKILLLTYYIL